MALRLIAVDDKSGKSGSPTVYVDKEREEFVLQGWVAGPDLVAEIEANPAPDHTPGIPDGEAVELRDRYLVPDEEIEFQEWRRTGALDVDPDSAGWSGWTAIVRSALGRGCQVQRLRIVTEPVTEYTRWLHAITAANVAAGEQVRWLPRAMARDLLIPAEDFWLLDDRVVAFNELDGEGNSHGWDLRADSPLAVRMGVAWSELWDRAIPHEKYEVH